MQSEYEKDMFYLGIITGFLVSILVFTIQIYQNQRRMGLDRLAQKLERKIERSGVRIVRADRDKAKKFIEEQQKNGKSLTFKDIYAD